MEKVTCSIVSHGCALFDLPQAFVSVVGRSLLYWEEQHHLRFVHFLSFAVTFSVPEALLLSYNFIHPFPLISLYAALKLKSQQTTLVFFLQRPAHPEINLRCPFSLISLLSSFPNFLQMNTNSLLCM